MGPEFHQVTCPQMPVITAPNASTALVSHSQTDELFPIREVARLTGINPVTLRAWERRYGLIQPVRTESGHRLYSSADIETVRTILDWVERGVAVSKVGKILARADEPSGSSWAASDRAVEEWEQWQTQLRRAISEFDDLELVRLYDKIFVTYTLNTALQDVLMPLWSQLLRHQGGFGQASEWLFFNNFLCARVIQRIQMSTGHGVGQVVLAAIAGECRQLELLVAGLLIGSEGHRVRIMALGQPLEELVLVCEKTRPQALVVFSNHAPDARLPHRLSRLAQTLNCPLFLAGDASDLAEQALAGSPIGCLGNEGRLMQRRLQQFLDGTLDT